MRLVTIGGRDSGRAGAFIGTDVLDLARAANVLGGATTQLPRSVTSLLASDDQALMHAERAVKTIEDASDAVKDRLRATGVLTPYAATPTDAAVRSSIVWSHGRAFEAHIAEWDAAVNPTGAAPRKPAFPFGHFKNPRSVIGDRDPILLPRNAPDMVDWEIEVSAVIGRTCHGVSRDEALDYVAGYTIINDVSARNWVDHKPAADAMALNMLGKQFASFCPLGPCVATKDEVPHPNDLAFSLRVNGVVMQSDNLGNAYFTIEELIAHVSRWLTLQPGDIVTRGTPGGVGYVRTPRRFLRAGDVVEMEAEGIGIMTNPVALA